MGKMALLFVLFLASCKKEEVMMKYAYITKDNVEYSSEKGYEMATTHLCPYETRLSGREVSVEQDRQRQLIEAKGKLVLADTLVGVDENVTKELFNKL